MRAPDTPSFIEYALVFLLFLLVGLAVLPWLQVVLSNPMVFSTPIRGLE